MSKLSNPFLLVLIGAVVTGLVQSSAAVTSVLITMAAAGAVIGSGGNSVFFIILGTNIGTCITSIIAGIGSSVNGRRASVIHLLFNVIGSTIFFIFLLLYKNFYTDVMVTCFGNNNGLIIAMFHVFFNLIGTAILLPFSNVLVKIATFIVPDKNNEKTKKSKTLDDRILKTPSVAIVQVYNATCSMAQQSYVALGTSINAFLSRDNKGRTKIDDIKITVSQSCIETTEFMVKLNGCPLNDSERVRLSYIQHALSDVERICDLAANIMRYSEAIQVNNLVLSPSVYNEISSMYDSVKKWFDLTLQDMSNRSDDNKIKIDSLENDIDNLVFISRYKL